MSSESQLLCRAAWVQLQIPASPSRGFRFSDLGRVNGEGILPIHELDSHIQRDIVEGRNLVRPRAAREKLSWPHPAVLRVSPSCLFHGTPPETLEMEHGASFPVGLHYSHHYDTLHHPLPCRQSWPCFDHSFILYQESKLILLCERKTSRHENVMKPGSRQQTAVTNYQSPGTETHCRSHDVRLHLVSIIEFHTKSRLWKVSTSKHLQEASPRGISKRPYQKKTSCNTKSRLTGRRLTTSLTTE